MREYKFKCNVSVCLASATILTEPLWRCLYVSILSCLISMFGSFFCQLVFNWLKIGMEMWERFGLNFWNSSRGVNCRTLDLVSCKSSISWIFIANARNWYSNFESRARKGRWSLMNHRKLFLKITYTYSKVIVLWKNHLTFQITTESKVWTAKILLIG
jgi:hypothetical protein